MSSEVLELVKCCICDGDEFVLVSDHGMYGFTTNVSLCINCGLVQLNPRWSSQKYDDFYRKEYDLYYRSGFDGGKNIEIILKRFIKYNFLPTNVKNILDIGSGNGDSINYLRKNHFQNASFYAIEPSVSCQENLKERKIKIIANKVEDWDYDQNIKFDIIIMRHVLEHLLDPVNVLKKISNSLSPDGVFYFAVPNSLNPSHPVKGSHFRNVHTYYFNKYSLDNLFRISGLKSLKIIEGDAFLRHEVFGFVKMNMEIKEPIINPDIVKIQQEIYTSRILSEDKFLYKLKKYFANRILKYWAIIFN